MSVMTGSVVPDSGSTGAPKDTLASDALATDFGNPDIYNPLDYTGHLSTLEPLADSIAPTADGSSDPGTGLNLPRTNSSVGGQIITAAEHYLGTRYLWGGTSAAGIDCSGLVQAAYKAAGIDLPRISFQQAEAGTRVSLKDLRPGDLVAWDNSPRNPGADHIAIYLGNGQIIEAAHPGTKVRIRHLGSNEGAWGVQMGW